MCHHVPPLDDWKGLAMLRLRHSNAGRQLGRIGLKPIGLDQHGLCADCWSWVVRHHYSKNWPVCISTAGKSLNDIKRIEHTYDNPCH
jgi:hypothetical protein